MSLRIWGGLGEVSWQVELDSPALGGDLHVAKRGTRGLLGQPHALGDAGCLVAWV